MPWLFSVGWPLSGRFQATSRSQDNNSIHLCFGKAEWFQSSDLPCPVCVPWESCYFHRERDLIPSTKWKALKLPQPLVFPTRLITVTVGNLCVWAGSHPGQATYSQLLSEKKTSRTLSYFRRLGKMGFHECDFSVIPRRHHPAVGVLAPCSYCVAVPFGSLS